MSQRVSVWNLHHHSNSGELFVLPHFILSTLRDEPIVPRYGLPRSQQPVYPPPPMSPPRRVSHQFSVPLPGNDRTTAGAVIQPSMVFSPTSIAPSGLPQTLQSSRTPHMPPVTIDIEVASRRTPSPPFFPPGHTFGTPPVSMRRDRPSRCSLSRGRRSAIIEPGSPHSPYRGSPDRPSHSHRTSHPPIDEVEPFLLRKPPFCPAPEEWSRNPSPDVVLPQPQPTVIVKTESRGRSRYRTPPPTFTPTFINPIVGTVPPSTIS